MFLRSLLATILLGTVTSLYGCGGDDADAADMSHCAATTCASNQVFNSKTCQCDVIDMASADR